MIRGISRFLQELKRRKVYRVATVYAITVWINVEVTDTIYPHLALPDGLVTAIMRVNNSDTSFRAFSQLHGSGYTWAVLHYGLSAITKLSSGDSVTMYYVSTSNMRRRSAQFSIHKLL